MMEPIGHYDPPHLAERIERRAYIVGGCARAMHPEGITRESNDGSSRSLANTAEPYRTFGDPDGVGHDDFEDAANCHAGSLPFFWGITVQKLLQCRSPRLRLPPAFTSLQATSTSMLLSDAGPAFTMHHRLPRLLRCMRS